MRINCGFGKLLSVMTLFGFVGAAYSATLYVSTQGNDSNPGTSSQPFRTITHAYGAASAGTTILVAPGTYTDYNSGWGIHLGKSGTASSPIILRSQTPGAAVIDGLNGSDRNTCFYIDGNYNVIDGFEIKNGPNGGITIWANNNQILNCNIHNNGNPVTSSTQGQDGVYSDENTSGNMYVANYIHHNGRSGNRLDHGLYICGDNEVVINNVLLANAGSGIQVAGYTTVSNLKVYNNVLAYNGTQGLILWQALSGVDIKNNIFYANSTYGINTSDAHGSGVSVDHNLFYGNSSGAYNMANNGSDVSYSLGTAVNSDPRLANSSSSSFDPHLVAGSPAIQSALNLYSVFTTDISGAARPVSGAWDLGAYEFGSSSSGGGGSSGDTTPPTASVSAPANGATVSGTLTITCSASDNVGVSSVQFQCDGANVASALTTAPWTTTLNTASLANGSHTLKAVARDAAGNQTPSAAVSINVSNAAATLPAVSVAATVPTAVLGTTNYGAFTFTRSGNTVSPLTVNYSVGGTAVKWNDYYRYGVGDMPASITIPAGASAYTMFIVARDNQTHANPETVTLALSADAGYQIGSAASATMTIVSNAPPPTTQPPVTVSLAKTPVGMKLTWNTVSGKTYRILSTSNVRSQSSSWTNLSGDVVATASSTTWTDASSSTVPQRFYKVLLVN